MSLKKLRKNKKLEQRCDSKKTYFSLIYFFNFMAVLGIIAATVAAIGDATHSVATSRLIWTDVGSFLETMGLLDTGSRLFLLITLEPDIFNLADRLFLQAPIIVVLGLFTILSILLSRILSRS